MRRASCGLEVRSATRKARLDKLNGVKCNTVDNCRFVLEEMYRVNWARAPSGGVLASHQCRLSPCFSFSPLVCLFFVSLLPNKDEGAGLPEAGHPHPGSFFNEGKRPSCRRTNNTELKMDGGARKEARCGKQNAGKEVGKRLTALNYGDQKGGWIHLHHLRTFKGAVIFWMFTWRTYWWSDMGDQIHISISVYIDRYLHISLYIDIYLYIYLYILLYIHLWWIGQWGIVKSTPQQIYRNTTKGLFLFLSLL